MSESSVRDLIRDELSGWHIGSGYYSTAVSADEARDMADAVISVLADLPDDVIEPVAALSDPDAVNYPKDSLTYGLARRSARKALAAAFGGDRGE